LLRDWRLAADGSCRAWLSVEAAHNDVARFWSGIIEAIGTMICSEHSGQRICG
jgi:ATP/maltotriose-dependent transcriptional regulator MalT